MADIPLCFEEKDVAGARLPMPVIEDNTVEDLARWIHTRGLTANCSESKTSLVKRVKDLQNSVFSHRIVDPDKNLSYDIIQAYIDQTVPKVTTPKIENWLKDFTYLPTAFSYANIYEYLIKRQAVVLDSDSDVLCKFSLPIADKPLVKGYNFFASGHLQEYSSNQTDNYVHIWSKVLASQKDQIYLCKISMDLSGIIVKSSCDCVAGNGGKCNHIAATLFAALDFQVSRKTSTTNQPQQWHAPSRVTKRKTVLQKIGDRNVRKHVFGRGESTRKGSLEEFDNYVAIPEPKLDLDSMTKGLREIGHSTCLHQLLTSTDEEIEETVESTDTPKTPEEIILSELKVDEVDVEKQTRGQAANRNWFRAKKGRITASMAKECCGTGNPSNKVKKIITVGDPRSKPKSIHMKYGVENEDLAAGMFAAKLDQENIKHNLRKCGLFVYSKNVALGASPDRVGMINGEDVVVEIKCLSASRELSPLDATIIKEKESTFAFSVSNGILNLKKNHKYYYQVQMQMAITGTKTCYLVVFTSSEQPVEYIKLPFDPTFWNAKEKLLFEFHSKYVLPALIVQRFGHDN